MQFRHGELNVNVPVFQGQGRHLKDRLRGRVVKGVGHLDHVRSYGVREVVSSIPDRGNIVG